MVQELCGPGEGPQKGWTRADGHTRNDQVGHEDVFGFHLHGHRIQERRTAEGETGSLEISSGERGRRSDRRQRSAHAERLRVRGYSEEPLTGFGGGGVLGIGREGSPG